MSILFTLACTVTAWAILAGWSALTKRMFQNNP